MSTIAIPFGRDAVRTAGLLPALLSFFLIVVLAGCGRSPPPDAVASFLVRHWQAPIPAQGTAPASYSPLEASLAPEACGTCHVEQYRDWRTALHSRTMGPGIAWQFGALGQEESNRCLRCHAPLAEQKALTAREMGWPGAPKSPPPAYVSAGLAHDGLVCAACHVRGHVRYGPPRPGAGAQEGAPHGGFVADQAFLDSRFCAACHQFPDDGPRLAGKLREDTYRQWLASPYAPDRPCQSCHMPGGRHLWRGIHDPDMVRKALAVELRLTALANGEYQAEVVARNKGAGHDLPTYLVPKIYLVLSLHRPGRPEVELARDVIGWNADINIEHEEFDTRIPAGASRRYMHRFRPPAGKWEVSLRADVAPGEHYERMFRYSLNNVSLSQDARRSLIRALNETVATRFTAIRVDAQP